MNTKVTWKAFDAFAVSEDKLTDMIQLLNWCLTDSLNFMSGQTKHLPQFSDRRPVLEGVVGG